jgi:tetratricopeptide (TPR) repeat protein
MKERAMKRSVVLMFVSALTATAAHAQPTSNDQVARDHYDKGKQLAADGQYAAAYGEFSAGYDASPRALFLFNMAECQRQLGNAQRAREFYDRFIAASPNDALVPTARARLAELPPAPRHDSHADAPAAKPLVPPPAPTPAPAAAAPADTATPAPTQISALTYVSPAASRSLVAPIATGIGALALGGVSLAFDLSGESTYHESLRAPSGSAQQHTLYESANNDRYAAEAFGGVAAVTAGVAIWLFARGDHHDHETTARRTRLAPTAGGMAVLGSF